MLCCMVWSWQPAYGLTGLEFFFSGSVISPNFLWFRDRRSCSPPLLFRPGCADSTEEAAIWLSGEMLNVYKYCEQERSAERAKLTNFIAANVSLYWWGCLCHLRSYSRCAPTCLCFLAEFCPCCRPLPRENTRDESERGCLRILHTLAVRPLTSSCQPKTFVFVKCCVTMRFSEVPPR